MAGLVVLAPAARATSTFDISAQGESYGVNRAQRVTVTRPIAPGRRPVAYFVHGGSWVGGNRAQWADAAAVWASRGWVTVNLDYTRGVEDGLPGDGEQMLADVAAVVEHYEVQPYADRRRQVIIGDSAGAYLAVMTAVKLADHFRGVIAWSPVVVPSNAAQDGVLPGASENMVALGRRAQEFFSYSLITTNPISYIPPTGGPSMWIAGAESEWVDWSRHGAVLCQALGARCRPHLVPGSLHGLALRDASPALQEDAYRWAMAQIRALVRRPDRRQDGRQPSTRPYGSVGLAGAAAGLAAAGAAGARVITQP
jgi:acetyl esterase/lipase